MKLQVYLLKMKNKLKKLTEISVIYIKKNKETIDDNKLNIQRINKKEEECKTFQPIKPSI